MRLSLILGKTNGLDVIVKLIFGNFRRVARSGIAAAPVVVLLGSLNSWARFGSLTAVEPGLVVLVVVLLEAPALEAPVCDSSRKACVDYGMNV